MEDRDVIIPTAITHPKALVAKDPSRPNNLSPAVLEFEDWFGSIVLTAPKWLEGETQAIVSATVEMQMELEKKFSGKVAGDVVRVTHDEHSFCLPIMKDKDRMLAGVLGPKSHKFIYAWMSAKKVATPLPETSSKKK